MVRETMGPSEEKKKHDFIFFQGVFTMKLGLEERRVSPKRCPYLFNNNSLHAGDFASIL